MSSPIRTVTPAPKASDALTSTLTAPNEDTQRDAAASKKSTLTSTDPTHDTKKRRFAEVEDRTSDSADKSPEGPKTKKLATPKTKARNAMAPTYSDAVVPQTKIANEEMTNVYGDRHAAKESMMMREHAKSLLKAGVIDKDMANQLSRPWHQTGILDMQWNKKYLDPAKDSGEEMMSIEKARKIKSRKDLKMQKWIEDFEAGKIDQDGNPIITDAAPKAPAKKAEAAPAMESEKEVEKDTPEKGKSQKEATPPSKPTIPAPPPAPKVAKAPKAKTPAPQLPQPIAGGSDYKDYNYFQLAAICRDRNLVSGGKADVLRARLIEDDTLVHEGKERTNKSPYDYAKFKRNFKTQAPVAATSSKRKRGGDDQEQGEENENADGGSKKKSKTSE